MREAWDRTDYERKKENKKREKNGILNFIIILIYRNGSITL